MRSSLLVCFTLLALSSFVATSPIAIPESAVTLSVNDVEAPEEAVLEARGLSKKQKAALAKKKKAAKAKAAALKKKKQAAAAKKKAAAKKAAAAAKAKAKGKTTAVVLASSTKYSGRGTFYTQDGNAGSCGSYNSDSALIVALNSPQIASFGSNKCGSHVTITNTANGRSVRAVIADTCPSCSYGSLDLSLGAYDKLGARDTGVLPITWSFS